MSSRDRAGYEVELHAPLESVHLGSALVGLDVEMTLVRSVPALSESAPYFYVRGGDVDAVDDILDTHERVREFKLLSERPFERLYQCVWKPKPDGLIATIGDCDGIVRTMKATMDGWTISIFFPSHERTTTFYSTCMDRDNDINIRRVRRGDLGESPVTDRGLSKKQLEAVRLAYEHGYFETPTETTLAELASYFEISEQALSQRLRRATRRMVQSLVADLVDEETDPTLSR